MDHAHGSMPVGDGSGWQHWPQHAPIFYMPPPHVPLGDISLSLGGLPPAPPGAGPPGVALGPGGIPPVGLTFLQHSLGPALHLHHPQHAATLSTMTSLGMAPLAGMGLLGHHVAALPHPHELPPPHALAAAAQQQAAAAAAAAASAQQQSQQPLQQQQQSMTMMMGMSAPEQPSADGQAMHSADGQQWAAEAAGAVGPDVAGPTGGEGLPLSSGLSNGFGSSDHHLQHHQHAHVAWDGTQSHEHAMAAAVAAAAAYGLGSGNSGGPDVGLAGGHPGVSGLPLGLSLGAAMSLAVSGHLTTSAMPMGGAPGASDDHSSGRLAAGPPPGALSGAVPGAASAAGAGPAAARPAPVATKTLDQQLANLKSKLGPSVGPYVDDGWVVEFREGRSNAKDKLTRTTVYSSPATYHKPGKKYNSVPQVADAIRREMAARGVALPEGARVEAERPAEAAPGAPAGGSGVGAAGGPGPGPSDGGAGGAGASGGGSAFPWQDNLFASDGWGDATQLLMMAGSAGPSGAGEGGDGSGATRGQGHDSGAMTLEGLQLTLGPSGSGGAASAPPLALKKRGRPPKTRDPAPALPAAPPKRRGRPPKNAAAADEDADGAKRRGRPTKADEEGGDPAAHAEGGRVGASGEAGPSGGDGADPAHKRDGGDGTPTDGGTPKDGGEGPRGRRARDSRPGSEAPDDGGSSGSRREESGGPGEAGTPDVDAQSLRKRQRKQSTTRRSPAGAGQDQSGSSPDEGGPPSGRVSPAGVAVSARGKTPSRLGPRGGSAGGRPVGSRGARAGGGGSPH